MQAAEIQKYSKLTVAALKRKAIKAFNSWIRIRDQNEGCISCGSFNTSDASHYYSAGHYNALRFNEDNVHLACKRCNLFLSGNLIEYRKNLLKKIGPDRLVRLDIIASIKKAHKDDRFTLIEIIQKYGNRQR